MIRLIQRRLIIPRGDTGTFTVPLLATAQTGDASVFTIFDQKTQKKVFEKIVNVNDEALEIVFSHADTVNLPVGDYVWDIKFYKDPVIIDNVLVDGTEIDSYYAAFKLPVCEIRQTGDTLLTADDAPTSTMAPEQLNIVLAAMNETNAAKADAANSATAAEASAQSANAAATAANTDAGRAEDAATSASTSASAASDSATAADSAKADAISAMNSAVAANTAAQTALSGAQAAATTATNKAAEATASAAAASDSATAASTSASAANSSANSAASSANSAAASVIQMDALVKTIPVNVSELNNDAGYITSSDVPVKDVRINSTSILDANGVANIPIANTTTLGTVKGESGYGIQITNNGGLRIVPANPNGVKTGVSQYQPIVPMTQHYSVFYGLAQAAGDTTQSRSANSVGTYTTEAKSAIQSMLDVPSNATVTSAISTAIGNINSFDMSVVQALPTENISTHTIYLVPKTGETNDIYDEYVYINNAWEMVGNTQIDLSNYVQKTDYATSSEAGVVKVGSGLVAFNGIINVSGASPTDTKAGEHASHFITPLRQDSATFYGLAKAAGDSTQSASSNAVGTYTNEAKAAIQQMLDVPSNGDLSAYATKSDTVLETSLSRGRKSETTIGLGSLAFGNDVEASNTYTMAFGYKTSATGPNSYSEGNQTLASGNAAHAEGFKSIANGAGSHAEGSNTIANAAYSHVEGKYNIEDSIQSWPTWTPNTEYIVGDKVKLAVVNLNNEISFNGYICKTANNDAEFVATNWTRTTFMNYANIIGNGTSNDTRSNAYALDWEGNGHFMGDVYVGANADSSGGTKLADVSELALKADKTDTVLLTTLSRGRKDNTTIGESSFAFGYDVEASGDYSFASGYETVASGARTYAEGRATKATAGNAHAEGNQTKARNSNAHAEGYKTDAFGANSHAEGNQTVAYEQASHAEGQGTTAESLASHAEGYVTMAIGVSSHSEGNQTVAIGVSSHTEGQVTVACGAGSHAEGRYNIEDSYNNWTEWTANTSYSIGDKIKITVTVDNETTVTGYVCKIDNQDAEFTEANWTKDSQMNYLHIAGNGSSTARSNAYALTWTGDGHYAGDVYVHSNADSTGGTKLATVTDLSNAIGDLIAIQTTQPTDPDTKIWIDDDASGSVQVPTVSEMQSALAGKVDDVQVNGVSVVTNGVAEIPIAKPNSLGAVKGDGSYGVMLSLNNNGILMISGADENLIKTPVGVASNYKPIVPQKQHMSVFYGLSKAAGVDLANETVTLGTYTDAAKTAIKNMIGVEEGLKVVRLI